MEELMKEICSLIKKPFFPYAFPHPKGQTAFFDIETTGLSPNASSLYLIGFMHYDKTKEAWLLRQWFADDYQSEKEILQTFLENLSEIKYLYHFNGKTFDIPYVLKKCTRHLITPSKHCENLLYDTLGIHCIDLLGKIRPLRHALMLEKCSQTALEQWLGIKREDTFSGGELISVYSEYMQQKILNPENAAKLEKVLLLHNHDDIEMMLNVCSILTYDEYLSDSSQNRLFATENLSTLDVCITSGQTVSLTMELPVPVPKTVHLVTPYPETSLEDITQNTSLCSMLRSAQLLLDKKTACFTLPLYEGPLKYFMPNYKDYYYLIKEDMAVHKSVAEYVDKNFRKKATAATCYINKEGRFLPNLPASTRKKNTVSDTADKEPAFFYLVHKDKLNFCELPEDYKVNTEFWKQYLIRQMPYFRKSNTPLHSNGASFAPEGRGI